MDLALEVRPTFLQRAMKVLGFRYHLGEEPEGADDLPGWMKTEAKFSFGFGDRLRLLFGGRLHVHIVQHTPVQCDYTLNRLDYYILPPGEKF